MATIYNSNQALKSKIISQNFPRRLSSIFGFQTVAKSKAQTEMEANFGIKFVKVDQGNNAYRFKQASLGNIFKSTPLSTPLQKYLEAYMDQTSLSYNDIAERQTRLNELRFAVCNDPFLSAYCTLIADEATQLDEQNRILTVESPSVAFTNKCYELFAQWGITQQRIHSACFDLAQYGEALWSHRVTDKGVERIIPLKVSSLMERLEFSPVHMAEYLAQMYGNLEANKNRSSKIEKLVDLLQNQGEKVNDLNENYADLFDTKLLGFEFQDGIIVPPWLVTHFRFNADNSEFFPYGYPPLLMALAPFKQCHSTIALQGLARSMSFPIQLYKVKNTEGISPYQAFDTTNTVREEFDNIGVTAASNSLEVYTINTKIWVPDGLVDLQVLESKSDIDFTGDLELYQDRVAIAAGVPKAYLDQEFGGFGNSGIALMEQYKPFGRKVYSIQSSFLEGLGTLIRLHFCITNEFSYNTPFILKLSFPAVDMGQEKREARAASIELANSIIEMIQGVLGLEEGDPLPEDVVSEILGKFTFLDASSLQRWIRLSAIQKAAAANAEASEGEGDEGDMNFGSEEGADAAGDMAEGDEGGGEEAPMEESNHKKYKNLKVLREKRKLREQQLREAWKKNKDSFYIDAVQKLHLTEWQNNGKDLQGRSIGGHCVFIPPIKESNPLFESFQVLAGGGSDKSGQKLQEALSVSDMMRSSQEKDVATNALRECIDLALRNGNVETDGLL